jgi:ABC-2 type transport system ATP-binding protein
MKPIEIQNLRKVFRDRKRREVLALDSLDLTVESGEVFGFLGPNGAGKSTTIKTVVGLIQPSSGQVSLFGKPASNIQSRKKLGYLPENPALYDFLTAREYLSMVGRIFGLSSREIARETDRVLELLDLRAAERRKIRTYSKGMVQRLGLAQALLHDPSLYVFDEPMSGLDPIGRALVKEILRDLKRQGKTVFFSTHVTADVEAVCDRVGVIVAGRLQAVNQVRDLMEKGIEGYQVQYSGCTFDDEDGFSSSQGAGGLLEAFVQRDHFNRFMELVNARNGKIHLVETRRRDLEDFFLQIVNDG